MVKQLLPLWYMELSYKERNSMCSPDQMVNVGGVQIPEWFWKRADAQTDVFPFTSGTDMQHAVSAAATFALLCEETEDKDVRETLEQDAYANLDEAFMMFYADNVKWDYSHEEAFLEALDYVQLLPNRIDDKRQKPFKAIVASYAKLREKAGADA